MSEVKVYQPKYYKNFNCTGSSCKNNCCHHWQIAIDKVTYDRYMSLEGEDKEAIIKNITVKDTKNFNAHINMDSNGYCSFLNEKGLCSLQLKLGHSYLGNVCRSYPRITNIISGSIENFLELSCEEAAKLILFEKDCMNFEELITDSSTYESGGALHNHTMHAEKYSKHPSVMDIFWKLRVASVAILQNRKYKIRLRMLILCLFIQEVAELFSAGRDYEAIVLADNYMNRLDVNYYNELASTMPNGADREFDVVLDILKEMFVKKSQFRPTLIQVEKGFDFTMTSTSISEVFKEKYSKYYDMYFSDKEYIFENYLVHRVLSEGFPFNYGNNSDIMSNYIDLLAKFDIVEFLLTGICRNRMKFDKRTIVDCISLFTRGYEHARKKYLQAESNT